MENEGTGGIMLSVMSTVTQVQILDKVVSISYITNILGKGINTTILLSATSK